MRNNPKEQKSCLPLCQTYKPTIILNWISKNVDQHTGDKRLIDGTKRRKENQLQSLELPVKYHNRECKHDIKKSKGNMFNPLFKEKVQGRKHPGSCAFAEPELLM